MQDTGGGRYFASLTALAAATAVAMASFDNAEENVALLAPCLIVAAIAGAYSRRWYVLSLSVLPLAVSLPFGLPDDPDLYDPVPLVIPVTIAWVPAYLVALALGVGFGRLLYRER